MFVIHDKENDTYVQDMGYLTNPPSEPVWTEWLQDSRVFNTEYNAWKYVERNNIKSHKVELLEVRGTYV